jgi:tRNA1(Val) A37 N6-methylase TrmN6
VPGLRVTLTDIDPVLVALARDNAARNGLADRVTVVIADAGNSQALSNVGLGPGCAQHVLMNPPFNDPATSQISTDPARARAHTATGETLTSWLATAARLLEDHGSVTLIWRSNGLADVLPAPAGLGGIVVMPVHPRPDTAAIRVLVRAAKGSRAPLRILPGLMLNDAQGHPSAVAEAVLRDATPLALA